MLYALLGAVAIGLVLGLLGSGGSILTVPVLVYLAGQPDKIAIAESLAIVGAIAAVGASTYARQQLVDWRSVLGFGVPGILGTYGGAALAAYVPGTVQLALFGVVMLAAAAAMLRGRAGLERDADAPRSVVKIAALGDRRRGDDRAGGRGRRLPHRPGARAAGRARHAARGRDEPLHHRAQQPTGFIKYLDTLHTVGLTVDWRLVGIFAAIGIAGSFVGNALSQRVPQAQLKRGFAIFLIVMGGFILAKEGPTALGMKDVQAATAPAMTEPAVTEIVRLSPAETAAYLAETPEAVVVDVRTPGEVAASGRLAGALVLDVTAPDFEARALDALDPARPVVLYCRSGNRSGKAAERLAALGFTHLSNAGGFDALADEGLPTEPYAP